MKKLTKGVIALWVIAILFLFSSFSFIAEGNYGSFVVGLVISAALAFWGWKKYNDPTKDTIKSAPVHTHSASTCEPVKSSSPAVSVKLPSLIELDGVKYELKYSYKDVAIVASEYVENSNLINELSISDILTLESDPNNAVDPLAVSFINKDGQMIGYLAKGGLQDMANDFIKKDKPIIAYVSNVEPAKVSLGFYALSSSEIYNKMKDTKPHNSIKLTGNTNSEMQETISLSSVGDAVTFEYDPDKSKYVAMCGSEIGYLPASKSSFLDNDKEYSAFIEDISENDNLKYVVTVSVFEK